MTDISVVIPCFADARTGTGRLRVTAAAFANQSLEPDGYEVIIVDDGSEVDIAEAVNSWDLPRPPRVLRQVHGGMCSAYNRGIAAASAPIVLLGLDDTVPRQDLLAHHLGIHASNDDRLVAVGRELFLFHAALFRDPTTGEIAEGALDRLIATPGLGWFSAAVERFDLQTKIIRQEDAVHHFDRLEALAASIPAYRDIYRMIDAGLDGVRAPWLVMRVGNHSVNRSMLERVGGFDIAFDAHSGWYSDLDLGMRLVASDARFATIPEATTVNLWHAKDARQGLGAFTGHAYFLSKAPTPDVAYLPMFFHHELQIDVYGAILSAVDRWWRLPGGSE